MKYKESEYKYAVYRKNKFAKGYTLHSKHMTKKRAEESLRKVKKRFKKGHIKNLKKGKEKSTKKSKALNMLGGFLHNAGKVSLTGDMGKRKTKSKKKKEMGFGGFGWQYR